MNLDKINNLPRKQLIRFLKKQRVRNVKYKNRILTLSFLGNRMKFKVIRRHIGVVGNWDRKRNIIYVDKKIIDGDLAPVLVHEAVEKFVTRKFGLLVDSESHKIAQAVEHSYAYSKCKPCWHERRIAYAWITRKRH